MGQAAATPVAPHDATERRMLERITLALSSTLELREVLRVLAEITLEESAATRCSLFLAEADEALLRPAVSLAEEPDEDLWEAFREMSPVELTPLQSRLLAGGRAVPIENVDDSELIPRSWVERFALRSMVLVPLVAAGEPCGMMAVDYPEERVFSDAELRLLEALGASAGVAVRNAQLYDATRRRARLQETLARATAALARPLEPQTIGARLAAAYTDLLDARCCAVGVLDSEGAAIIPLLVTGGEVSESAQAEARERPVTLPPAPLAQIPAALRQRLAAVDEEASPRACELDGAPWFADAVGWDQSGATHYLAVPILGERAPRGGVVLGFDRSVPLDQESRAAAETLASVAGVALERHDLLNRLDQKVQRLDALYRLSSAVTERADARMIVTRLNELLAGHDVEVVDVGFRERAVAKRLGGEKPTAEERRAWRSGDGCMRRSDADLLSVPMRLGRRVYGVLRVRPADVSEEERAFLVTLAAGVAEVASRGALRASLEEAGRQRALAAERDRIAGDLHDSVGQLFVAIGLLARRQADQLPADSPWKGRIQRLAELADGGKWELEQAIRALAFVPAERRGLVAALRELAESFATDSGIEVDVTVDGDPGRLTPESERALYRITNEALTNAWRHARCSYVRLALEFSDHEVALTVRDDGVGLGPRQQHQIKGLGVLSMRRAIAEVDGSLRVRNMKPHGVQVDARVPR